MCRGVQNFTCSVASLSYFLFRNENTAAKYMQTYHIIATPVTLKWNCFSEGQYCGVIYSRWYGYFFLVYSMQINVLALIPSLY